MRIRGNAWQVHEKYLALARDASASGDRIAAENFYQHAEHYYRLIAAAKEESEATRGNGGQGRRGSSGRRGSASPPAAADDVETAADESVETRPEQTGDDPAPAQERAAGD